MSFQEYLIHSYLLIGVLLGVTLAFWGAFSWAIQRYGISIKSIHHLRISQFLVLSALISGSIAPCLPSLFPNLKTWASSQVQPVQLGLEGIDPDYDGTLRPQSDLQKAPEVDTESSKQSGINFKTGLLLALSLGFALFCGRTLLRIFSLRRIISQATLLRKSRSAMILVSDQSFIEPPFILPIRE